MKILVLLHRDLVPPDKFHTKKQWAQSNCKTEYDVVNGLKELNHKVLVLGIDTDLSPLREAIQNYKPKLVFNLLEEFDGEGAYDQNVVSYLELLRVPYTGCNPRGLILGRDKALSKKILKYHRVKTPNFYIFEYRKKLKTQKQIKIPKGIQYPLFTKMLYEEASLGITQSSIVKDEASLQERVLHFFNKYKSDVIAESYIQGRELYVGIMGLKRLETYAVWELFFNKMPESAPKIATEKVKWDFNYREKYGITTGPAKKLSEQQVSVLKKMTKRSYRALGLSGYARMDYRMNEAGEIYLIEVNPNPDIGYKEDLSASAELDGVSYQELLKKIIRLGLQ
jgi:D-alanine-D-alanine ligase